jgi:cyclophilin family peptidyl-prolyl cis-trans isomerase
MSILRRFSFLMALVPGHLPLHSLAALLLAFVPLGAANQPPVLDSPVAATGETQKVAPRVPVGKTLLIPLTATDADGDPLSYSVKSSNRSIIARVKTGNPFLKLSISSAGSGASPAFAGDMVFQLFRDWAPRTTDFIAGFAQSGFYEGLTFHRIADLLKDTDETTTETSFIAQGGDPTSRGAAAPTFRFENEFHPGVLFSGRGQLAMANAGYRTGVTIENNQLVYGDYSATNSTQFFITDGQPRFLDFKHTIFGQLTRGWQLLDQLVAVPRDTADKPTAPVTITAATVEPNNHDAVLVLAATDAGASLITVTVTDAKGAVSTKSFNATAVDDEFNSRPFLVNPGDATTGKDRPFRVGASTVDLEFDYIFRNLELLSLSSSSAKLQQGVITPNPGYSGPLRIGFTATEYDMTYRGPVDGAGEQIADRTGFTVAVGDKPIGGAPVEVHGRPTVAISDAVVARIQDADARGSAADLTAKINWGDGASPTTGTIAADPTKPGFGRYVVTGTRTYARAGFYPVAVEITSSKGAKTLVYSHAIVAEGAISLAGEEIFARTAALENRLLATFSVAGSQTSPADYELSIDWGDGTVTGGKIKPTSAGSFAISGSHNYGEEGTYSVRIQLRDRNTGESKTAWTRVVLTGFQSARSLPPFPQAHLVAAWEGDPVRSVTGSGAKLQAAFSGSFIIINSGNKTSPSAKLRFWLSPDRTLNKGGASADLPLKIGTLKEVTIAPLKPGAGVRYVFKKEKDQDLRLKAPEGESGAALTIMAELDYSDPIIDHSAVDKVALWGPISAIIVTTPGALMTNEAGSTAELTVRLEKKPTANVTIVVSSSDATEGTIELPEATGTPAKRQLIFTPENFAQPQTVRVKGVADNTLDGDINYSIVFAAATSTDERYNGMLAAPVAVKNLDGDNGIRVNTSGALTTSEAGVQASYAVVLEKKPTANVTIGVESSDLTEGTVAPASLTFTPDTWNTPQVVTVTGVDDAEIDGDVVYSVRLTAAVSTDPFYNGKVGSAVTVTNLDNDSAE